MGDAAARFASALAREPDRALAGAAELGLLSMFAPAAVGGLDADADALSAVLRPVAREDAGVAAALLVHAVAQRIVRVAGAWPDTVAADELLAWPAFAGQTAGGLLSLDGAGRIGGRVPLVPLARDARHFVLLLGGDAAALTIATCRADQAGVSLLPVDVLGLEGCAPSDLELAGVFADVRGPRAPHAHADLRASTAIAVAAVALGLLDGVFATASTYAADRRQGGRAIADWPEVRRLLAEIRDSIVVLDAALAGVSAARADGGTGWHEAAEALARRATDAACAGSTDGVQLLGGNGYTKDYPQERRMRDARQLRCLQW